MTAEYAESRLCGVSGETSPLSANVGAARERLRGVLMMRSGGPAGGGPGGHHGDAGFGFGFGPRGFGGPRGFRGRGGRARRGDIRTAVLLLLAEEPRNGYAIMREIEERSNGVWAPSAGSVYPALSQLEDEGLIRLDDSGGHERTDGGKLFALTDAGRAYLAKRPADAAAPWDTLADGASGDVRELHGLIRQVAVASAQLAQTASEQQLAEGKKVLTDARRALYRILADGEDQA
ncbi:MAG: PadR family transcriptional regulator [Solirubrobacteraceae bacterium]|jgi:DNA-binding PadR family transcriptional regulator